MFQILHRKYDNLKNLLEFNLNNMEINLKQYSQNELINIFSIGAISNNILQIGFDEYKVLLFLLSNETSKIKIFEFTNKSRKNFDYLNKCFPSRISIIYGNPHLTIVEHIQNNFDKFDLIHVNSSKNYGTRLDILNCYYVSDKKTFILYESLMDIYSDLLRQKIAIECRENQYLLENNNKQFLIKYSF